MQVAKLPDIYRISGINRPLPQDVGKTGYSTEPHDVAYFAGLDVLGGGPTVGTYAVSCFVGGRKLIKG